MRLGKQQYLLTIRALKIITKLFILAVIAGLTYLAMQNNVPKVAKSNSDTSQSERELVIENPLFNGADQLGNRYNIHSKNIHNVGDSLYNMEHVDGNYNIKNLNLEFNAAQGLIDNKKHSIALKKNVIMDYDQYHLTADQMNIDMNNKTAFTDTGVKIEHHNSEIEAKAVHVNINNGIFEFDGNVTTHFKTSDFK